MQVERLQEDIVASHGVGDAQDAQDDAVRALPSGRNFFFCDVRVSAGTGSPWNKQANTLSQDRMGKETLSPGM